MEYEIRAFDETTLSDAKSVVAEMFGAGACPLLDKMLANPIRREVCPNGAAGEIVYQDGRPVAFQGAILRRLYMDRTPMLGVVGSTLCSKPETSPVLLAKLMRATINARYGSEGFFANTANATSMKMNHLLGVKGCGPKTCEHIRFCIVWVPFFPKWMVRLSPDVRSVDKIDTRLFDAFWEKYLETNEGLLFSRKAKELEWMFGAGIKAGTVRVLGAFDGAGALEGYIVLRATHNGRRWMVNDWIALRNDERILKLLIRAAVAVSRRSGRGYFLEMVGYPEWADRIASSALPFVRKTKNNSFLWKFHSKIAEIPKSSWFYGAYDGDRSLG